jgi:putative tryptophan/tyrosine transport system substrate-binding protein
LTQELGAKRLGLLNVVAPNATTVALLVNPTNPATARSIKQVQEAARDSGRQIQIFEAHTQREIDAAFELIVRQKISALLVSSDPFFTSSVAQIATLGSRAAIPAIYPSREFAEAGGIMSYGADVRDDYRKAGVYAGRILQGTKPADLPVMQSTKFELIINLKTAKTLGLKISEPFLLLADEVIE